MEQEKLLQEYSDNIYEEQNQGENIPENDNNNGIKKYLLVGIVIVIAIAGVMYANKKNADNPKDQVANEEVASDENLTVKEKQEKQRKEDLADLAILGNEGEAFNVYFSKTDENDCGRVYPVERTVGEGEEMISTSLFHLFSGPTEAEKEAGYTSPFFSNALYILKWVKVTGGNAYVNLKDIREAIPNASTSCGNEQFESQIKNTINQFVDVDKLIIAIEDNPETYYEWNQIGCQDNLCDLTPFETGLNFGSEE